MEFLNKSGVSESIGKFEIFDYFRDHFYTQLAPIVLVLANYVMIPMIIDSTSH